MKKILILALGLICFGACAQLDSPELDDSTALSALKAYVYVDESLTNPKELDLLSGLYVEEKGSASFTFPADAALYNETTLSRCRIEASIDNTSRVELTDEEGNGKGVGLGGWHNLYNQTIYFKVIAANGDFKQYKVACKCKN